jgi:hypothetical protein
MAVIHWLCSYVHTSDLGFPNFVHRKQLEIHKLFL